MHDRAAFTIEIKETLVSYHSGRLRSCWQQHTAAKNKEEGEEEPVVSLHFHLYFFLRDSGSVPMKSWARLAYDVPG